MRYSIITCTYNSEGYVQKNIKSVREQTFKDFEHIFIDGESTDNTINIIKEYIKKNNKNVSLYSQKPGGISKAMNKGIRQAKGKYIIHLHSDDSFYDKYVLQNIDKFLETNRNLDRIYGKANIIEEHGKSSIGIFPNHKIFQRSSKSFIGKYFLKYFNYIPHQAVFIKKSVFRRFGYFDETISSSMDPDMRLRIRKQTNRKFIDQIVCNYMIRADAQSSGEKHSKQNHDNWKTVIKKHCNLIEYPIILLFNKLISIFNKTKR